MILRPPLSTLFPYTTLFRSLPLRARLSDGSSRSPPRGNRASFSSQFLTVESLTLSPSFLNSTSVACLHAWRQSKSANSRQAPVCASERGPASTRLNPVSAPLAAQCPDDENPVSGGYLKHCSRSRG